MGGCVSEEVLDTEMRDKEKKKVISLLVDQWGGKVAFALTLKKSHQR